VSISVQKRSISVQKCSEVFKAGYFLPAFAPFLTRFPLPILPKRYTLTPATPFFTQKSTPPPKITKKIPQNPQFPTNPDFPSLQSTQPASATHFRSQTSF
jgi:hypothetical protein